MCFIQWATVLALAVPGLAYLPTDVGADGSPVVSQVAIGSVFTVGLDADQDDQASQTEEDTSDKQDSGPTGNAPVRDARWWAVALLFPLFMVGRFAVYRWMKRSVRPARR